MYAAAEGKSRLGIPESVGKEFVAADAESKTLYVYRPLLNGDVLREWARTQGFDATLPADDLHATVAFSKSPVDWGSLTPRADSIVVSGGPRSIEMLGDKGAVVLRFESDRLDERHQQFCDNGAVWDHPSYKPHVTITYENDDVDLSKVMPFDGALEFGPEVFEEVNEKWLESVVMVGAHDSIAMDRNSIRRIDADGHLFVEMTPISKANICPYYGREIPNCAELGLDPDRIYKLYRDPKELANAATSFAGKPILLIHTPISADEHPREVVVGSVGNTVEFNAPYLMAPLSFWDGEAIDLIETDKQKELSCGYRYRADMTPGTINGESYDGSMRDIGGNHVALVKEGRAGPDVVVGDSAIQTEEPEMAKKIALSKAKSAALTAVLTGKLAQDENVEEVIKKIMALDDDLPKNAVEDEEDDDAAEAMDDAEEDEKDKRAEDESEEDDDKKAEDEESDKDETVSKKAMDRAIASRVKIAQDEIRRNMRELREAEEDVRPYVGKLAQAHDSAEGVYRTALKALNVNVDGVHPSALKVILHSQPKPNSNIKTAAVAMDSASAKEFAERFPHANRLK